MPERHAHIPTHEIERDICETEREIAEYEEQALHFEATPQSSPDYRLNHMRASARRTGIGERKAFIEKLQSILDYRGQNLTQQEKADSVAKDTGARSNEKMH